MKNIGLFYAPEKGNTESVAKKIRNEIGTDAIDFILVDESIHPQEFEKYNKLILGISTVGRDTWDSDYKKIGWDILIPKFDDVDLSGKIVAIFGLGDHITYSGTFVDGMGILAEKVKERGAKLVGQRPLDDYDFIDSMAVVNDEFVGLPVDEDNDYERTDDRIKEWIKQIKPDFEL